MVDKTNRKSNNHTKFWINDPSELFKNMCRFNPLSDGPFNCNLNSYTRFVILVSLITFCITKDVKYLYIGIFIMMSIVAIYYMWRPSKFENFDNNINQRLNQVNLPRRKSDYFNTSDSNNNPLKNNTIPEYGNQPEFSEATPSNNETTKFVKGKIFQQASDFIFDTGTRQYHTMPNTSIPNEQTGFANWCYGSETNCKAGSIHRNRTGTPVEQALCTGFDSTGNMTNFGNLNDYVSN